MNDDRKTTNIPSFLTGGDNDMDNTVEVSTPVEEHYEEPVKVVKKHRTNSSEVRNVPAPLDNVVRKLSMAVIVALALYIVFNIYLAVFDVGSSSTDKPKQTAAPVETVEPTPVPTTGTVVSDGGVIGSLSVSVDAITMRNDASVNADEMGTVYYGEQYQVYEVREADGYTWYKIDQTNGGWIASDGTWVTYSAN